MEQDGETLARIEALLAEYPEIDQIQRTFASQFNGGGPAYCAFGAGRYGSGRTPDAAAADWLKDRKDRWWPTAEDCDGCNGHRDGLHRATCPRLSLNLSEGTFSATAHAHLMEMRRARQLLGAQPGETLSDAILRERARG